MSVAEAGYQEEGLWCWNFASIVGELGEVDNQILEQFVEQLSDVVPAAEGDDVFNLIKENDEVFSVNSCYKVFANRDSIEWISLNMKAALTQLWKVRVSSNILMFGWRFVLNRLPTRDNLLVRGIELAETETYCVLCEAAFVDRFDGFSEQFSKAEEEGCL
ncbi:uncharacterized protein LOC131619785 [Vicia villosa]|uniref:uncharacterized protein LOC131619785 n=1 Tax=Vicia villosa TaxID=3911 RepID=UPI00273CCF29|nr:uncharacterized protein LOC131619785 [Vicia villosa]